MSRSHVKLPEYNIMTDFPRSNRQKKLDGKVYQKRPLIVYLLNDRVVSGVKRTILEDISLSNRPHSVYGFTGVITYLE